MGEIDHIDELGGTARMGVVDTVCSFSKKISLFPFPAMHCHCLTLTQKHSYSLSVV